MEDKCLLQFHEELEAIVTRIINRIRVTWPYGCYLGNVDTSPIILRYLWGKFLTKQPMTSETYRQAIKEVENTLSPLVTFKANVVESLSQNNQKWYEYLKGQEHKLLLFATSPRILDYLSPLIKALKDDFIILTMTPIPDGFEIPSNGTVIRFSMPKAKLFRNAELEQALPWFYNFANAISWFIEILNPKLFICMDGCQSEYRLAAAFCDEKHIPSICLQLGWPSYLHTAFRDMPYTYFFTWGDKFNPLWKKNNKNTHFISTGYMDEVTREGSHQAITFFLQAPIHLNTETYLDQMCSLIQTTALRYPHIPILVREHPEYRGKTIGLSRLIQFQNVTLVNNDKLANVYSRTNVVVSHFSSVLMEGLMYGCVPLVFNPTPGSRYNPDIEREGLGFISKNEDDFFSKLSHCFLKSPSKELSQWFKATGNESINNILKAINNILK